METIYAHAGGHEALRHFIDIFYASVLADPLLHPLREVPKWTWSGG